MQHVVTCPATDLCLDDALHDALELLALHARADALEALPPVGHRLVDRHVQVVVRLLRRQVLHAADDINHNDVRRRFL